MAGSVALGIGDAGSDAAFAAKNAAKGARAGFASGWTPGTSAGEWYDWASLSHRDRAQARIDAFLADSKTITRHPGIFSESPKLFDGFKAAVSQYKSAKAAIELAEAAQKTARLAHREAVTELREKIQNAAKKVREDYIANNGITPVDGVIKLSRAEDRELARLARSRRDVFRGVLKEDKARYVEANETRNQALKDLRGEGGGPMVRLAGALTGIGHAAMVALGNSIGNGWNSAIYSLQRLDQRINVQLKAGADRAIGAAAGLAAGAVGAAAGATVKPLASAAKQAGASFRIKQ